MHRPTLPALLVALALAACTHATTMPVNLVSRAEFPPAERERVWTRALVALQEIALVGSVDGPGHVATTVPHELSGSCGKAKCSSTGTLQVVVAPAGTVSVRYNRVFTGEVGMKPAPSYGLEELLRAEDVAALQVQLDRWVAEVVRGPAQGATGR